MKNQIKNIMNFKGEDFSEAEIHRILGILSVNSFVVHDGGSDDVNTDLVNKEATPHFKN